VIDKVLVANRGEIAIRAFRAAYELGIATVAIYPYEDRNSEHRLKADESYQIGEKGHPVRAYLSVDEIVATARRCGADAIYPGYGFLSENPELPAACAEAGITFIGPSAHILELTGNKARAIEAARAAGLPVLNSSAPSTSVDELVAVAAGTDVAGAAAPGIEFPLFVKAVSGGGGRGMRRVTDPAALPEAIEAASREAESAFGDPTVYLEQAVLNPRHVEVQILADTHGNVIHLGERDCSVQRRHQKVIEESPAPAVDAAMREAIGKIGVDAARAVDYVGAGTIEGLLQDGEYFFLEMNTRVQVEHCVTEMVTGIDIVKEGIRAAAGLELNYAQDDIVLRGHAIECRINAEDASKNFAPAPGRIGAYKEPTGPGVRVDSGVGAGGEVSPMYDPMVAKLIVWDADREQATQRMLRALGEYEIEGLKTLIPFHQALLATEQWHNGETCRDLLESADWLKTLAFPAPPQPGDDGEQETVEQSYTVEVGARRFDVKVIGPAGGGGYAPASANGASGAGRKAPQRAARATGGAGGPDELVAPLQGNMWKVLVEVGQAVTEGQIICIIEAMKMENEIVAHKAGVVESLAVKEGEPIQTGAPIAVIKAPAE
jgi:acetyl-CoA/propionyl-CoA carboxylase biotin carboxyl carrier protein